MGILDKLLGRDVNATPEGWDTFLQQTGFRAGQRVSPQQLQDLYTQYGNWRSANQQAPGLAQQLTRAGMGPLDRTPPEGGFPASAAYGTPASPGENAVALMMNPQNRVQGVAMAQGLLTPLTTAQQAVMAEQHSQFQTQEARASDQFERTYRENVRQFGLSYALDKARTDAAKFGAGAAETVGLIKNLTGNYATNMAAPLQVADATQQISGALSSGDSIGALAAVIKLAKILDPTSVVREGEVTTVQGGLGTAQALINSYNKVLGKGFDPAGAKNFARIVQRIAGPILQRGQRIKIESGDQAARLGLNPETITTGIGWPADYVQAYLQNFPNPEVKTDF